MHRTSFLFVVIFSLLIPFHSADGQQQQQQQPEFTVLQLGTPIERTIAVRQAHFYTLKLETGQFAQVVIDQHGIDVIISVASPQSKMIGDFDSPNGVEGPENVPIVAETTGDYTLVVRPLNQEENVKPGRYEIRVLELRKATDQELSSIVDQEELRAKAMTLVKDATLGIPQIRSLPIRVQAQMKAAGLLWPTDNQTASKLMNDAMAGLKEYMSAIDMSDPDSFQNLQAATVLRYELIQAIGDYDPEAALNFLRSSRPPVSTATIRGCYICEGEDQLELTLANKVAQKDPKRAYQIAQESLKTRLSGNLFQTVNQLLKQDPELARKLAKEITAKLLDAKLLKNHEVAELALNLLRNRLPVRRRPINEINSQQSTQDRAPLLSDQDRRALLEKTLNEALTGGPPNPNSSDNERNTLFSLLYNLKEIGPELDSQFPGSQVAVEKRLTEVQKEMEPQRASWMKYQQIVNNNPPEAAAEALNQSPPDIRQQLFQQLADRTAASGDINRARQIINDKVTNPWQRQQALMNLERQAIYHSIAKGKIEEALRALAVYRPARARAGIIAEVVRQIGPGRKRPVAIALLEQARSFLGDSPLADNQDEMNALIEIAIAFARYDTKRSFEIIDPLIDQFNEVNEAARKLSGFGQETHMDGEVNLYNGNLVMTLTNQITRALALLSMTNFERAKSTADRIQPPEIRLVAYLTIAAQILKPGER